MQNVLTRVGIRRSPQPDAVTCQATCLANVANLPGEQIPQVRNELLSIGDPGNPNTMALWANKRLGSQYSLDIDASLKDCQNWLSAGDVLITHGWFTGSGHVIMLDGFEADPQRLNVRYNVFDPWDEFEASAWRYRHQKTCYDGFYSAQLIYAACVAGQSPSHAASIYRRGELNSQAGGMWVHRIRPR